MLKYKKDIVIDPDDEYKRGTQDPWQDYLIIEDDINCQKAVLKYLNEIINTLNAKEESKAKDRVLLLMSKVIKDQEKAMKRIQLKRSKVNH